MKKVIAIFLLLQILSSNAFAEELIRMPRLFTHYYHHSQEHKDVKDFFDFLHKHYSDHHQKDEHSKSHDGDDNDCQLPFKHCGGCCLNAHTSVIGFIPSILNADYVYYHVKNTGFTAHNDRFESLDICNIWQPPKIS